MTLTSTALGNDSFTHDCCCWSIIIQVENFQKMVKSLGVQKRSLSTTDGWWNRTSTIWDQTVLPQHQSMSASRPHMNRLPNQGPQVRVPGTWSWFNFTKQFHRGQIADLLRILEPKEVWRRKGRKFKWKWFYAAGIMAILVMDQHDKWGH